MKTLSAFLFPVLSAVLPAVLCVPVAGQAVRFLDAPHLERFAGGAFEWSASVNCDDPLRLLGAHIDFSFDADLDGVGDTLPPTQLSPADCADGALGVRRPFSDGPWNPSILSATLTTDSGSDVRSTFTGQSGTLLSLHAFCASPRNGEPEWIEIRNGTSIPINLSNVRLEGRALAGFLGPGEILAAHAAADSAEMRLWRPGVRAFPLSSWPGLRNTGDTLRLRFAYPVSSGVPLDSVAYSAERGTLAGTARASCASAPTEETPAAAQGFGLEFTGRWRRRSPPFDIRVTAPPEVLFDLILYDLDGLEVCRPARRAKGPQTLVLTSESCPGLPPGATSALLMLRPKGAQGVRRILRIEP